MPERQRPLKRHDLTQRPTRESLCEELRRIPGGADPALVETLARGVAFHHAGKRKRGSCCATGVGMLNSPAGTGTGSPVWILCSTQHPQLATLPPPVTPPTLQA